MLQTNTLQCVLVTDGIDTFIIFLYGDIHWTSGTTAASGGPVEALAGYNAGDGINSFTIPGSLTTRIINITETSNVGIPGTWMFQLNCSGTYCVYNM